MYATTKEMWEMVGHAITSTCREDKKYRETHEHTRSGCTDVHHHHHSGVGAYG